MLLVGGIFGKWLGHEDVALMNGITALIKKIVQRSLHLPLCENTMRSL